MMGATSSAASSGRVWLDLARAGNFPSVASNVLAALVLSSVSRAAMPQPGILALAVLAGCLAYAGGATLNDVADAKFDAQHRPERPLPRNRVSHAAAAAVGGVEIALGLALLIGAGASPVAALALAGSIVIYDWIHKRWAGSVVLMAGCRGLLAVTIATLPNHALTPAFLGWVAALFLYIVTLSLVARAEYGNALGKPARLGRMVGRLLAFIPLIDAIALLLTAAWIPALACALAIPLGKWAQRRAAST